MKLLLKVSKPIKLPPLSSTPRALSLSINLGPRTAPHRIPVVTPRFGVILIGSVPKGLASVNRKH